MASGATRVTAALLAALVVGGVIGGLVDHYAIKGGSGAPEGAGATATSTSTSTSATGAAAPTTSTTSPGTSSTPATGSRSLPVSVSQTLSSAGQAPSILLPASCTVDAGVATAKGKTTGVPPEVYRRYGDVVELYVFSGTTGAALQLATLPAESPGTLGGTWTATVPIAPGFGNLLGPAAVCEVAVQSTHAFMGAGNAGG